MSSSDIISALWDRFNSKFTLLKKLLWSIGYISEKNIGKLTGFKLPNLLNFS